MFATLAQRVVRVEQQRRRQFIGLSLRVAGVLAVAILVFVALYFFVASLEVPLIHRG